jgi:predicted MFS family arabinose efflux permease
MFGMLLLFVSDVIMFFAPSVTVMLLGVLFWGFKCGATQNIFVSLIAEKVPEDLRGTGFGVYWITGAFSAFIADSVAGYVSHHFSIKHAFISSGLVCVCALAILYAIMNHLKTKKIESFS